METIEPKFGLSSTALTKIRAVFKKFTAISEVIIYGSRAKGNYREGSDIDISLNGKLTFEELLQVEKQLDNQLLPYTFDISIYSTLSNKDLISHIDRYGKTLYTNATTSVEND